MIIKICGIRRPEDIIYVNEFKPDYIGFVFAESKRRITAENAAELKKMLSQEIKAVGVFVNCPIERTAEIQKTVGLDVIQLHGDENISYLQKLKSKVKCDIWKAVRVRNQYDIEKADNIGANMLLLDAFSPDSYGGTGKTADTEIINKARFKTPFFIAGGLSCGNIKRDISQVSPDGVDISGGVETDGFKDREKIKNIINIVRSVNLE